MRLRRKELLQLWSHRQRLVSRRCSLLEAIDVWLSPSSFSGRSRDNCEIHIDGNMFFWIAAAAGAGLAFLTFQAITMRGRKRRNAPQSQLSFRQQIEDVIHLGDTLSLLILPFVVSVRVSHERFL